MLKSSYWLSLPFYCFVRTSDHWHVILRGLRLIRLVTDVCITRDIHPLIVLNSYRRFATRSATRQLSAFK